VAKATVGGERITANGKEINSSFRKTSSMAGAHFSHPLGEVGISSSVEIINPR
jgi:hypothetical protein